MGKGWRGQAEAVQGEAEEQVREVPAAVGWKAVGVQCVEADYLVWERRVGYLVIEWAERPEPGGWVTSARLSESKLTLIDSPVIIKRFILSALTHLRILAITSKTRLLFFPGLQHSVLSSDRSKNVNFTSRFTRSSETRITKTPCINSFCTIF